jgi:hypothetical protein
MPPKKKSNKKKGKQKGSGGGGYPKTPAVINKPDDVVVEPSSTSAAATTTSPTEDVSLITSSKPTISIDCANSFASIFAADYPPKTTIRVYVRNELSKKEAKLADRAYEDCSAQFNRGIAQFHNMPPDAGPDNSRWHIAQGTFLDALETAMRYPGVFLKTTVSKMSIIYQMKLLLCNIMCTSNRISLLI